MGRNIRGPILTIIALLLVAYLLSQNSPKSFGGLFRGPEKIKLSDFKQKVMAGEVAEVLIKTDQISGKFKNKDAFVAQNPNRESQKEIEKLLDDPKYKVPYSYESGMSDS